MKLYLVLFQLYQGGPAGTDPISPVAIFSTHKLAKKYTDEKNKVSPGGHFFFEEYILDQTSV